MKNLILFTIVFSFSSISHSQTTTSTNTSGVATVHESVVNQTMLDNAAKAQQILNANPNSATPTSIKILSNKGSSATTTSSANLTDQDKQLSENFVHQGKANRIIQEKCVGEMKDACTGNEVDHQVMGMSPGLIKVAAQSYATFSAMSDGIFGLSKPPEVNAAGNGTATTGAAGKGTAAPGTAAPGTPPAAAKKEPATDYCKYIPAMGEAYATFAQKAAIKNLSNGGDTSQKEALLKAAASHDSRSELAQAQAVGWYGGAACYVIGYASGSFVMDTSLVVKVAAATLLGTFYQEEVGANKVYANRTRDIANSLPGKGDCNPITQNDCYCAQPETANDPTYCKAQIAAKSGLNSGFARTACTDNKMQIDPSCACEKTNSCFEKILENQGAVSLQFEIGNANSPFKSVVSLAHGKLESGTLSSQAYAGTAAIAKRALNDFASKLPAGVGLSLSQKTLADDMISKGIPAKVASLMAQNPPSQAAIAQAMSKTDGFGKSYQVAAYNSGKSNVVDFSGGNGLGISGKKSDKKSGMEDFLGKIPVTKAVTNGKVLEFAQKAEARATQITKSDRPIFEIISLRYQTSGRRLLQLDSSN